MDDFFRSIFLGFVRVHLLHQAAEGPIYGAEMMEKLARHGYDLGPGTLYPILHAMERGGYLTSEQRVVGGKRRKYYALTEGGQLALPRLRRQVRELVGEVLGGEEATDGPQAPPFADSAVGETAKGTEEE